MLDLIKKNWPLIAAVVVLWGTIAGLLILSLGQNQGHLVYVLDDPYIHMAMAKNLARHGTWGVNQGSFSSSSSSPLWTLILALAYLLFGVNEISPFILNLLFATLLLFVSHHYLKKYDLKPAYRFLILLAMIFFAPLPVLVFGAQEHILHALLTLMFVYCSAAILAAGTTHRRGLLLLLLLAASLMMARYEGLFVILVVCLLLFIKRRFSVSVSVAAAGILPVVIYGLISLSKGWYFLPNSILLKGRIPVLSSLLPLSQAIDFVRHFAQEAYRQALFSCYVLVLVITALLLFFFGRGRKRGERTESAIMIVIFVPAALLHILLARVDWFYRYEAYLIVLGLSVIGMGIHDGPFRKTTLRKSKKALIGCLALGLAALTLLIFLCPRARNSLRFTVRASKNIFEQQYQMGLFLREFYQGRAVAANDIGVINYLTDVQCTDLFALGSLEPARLFRWGQYNTKNIYMLARVKNIGLAIVYDSWYKRYGGLPPAWSRVGEWKICNNVVCGGGLKGGETVSFYAVDPAERDNLIENLKTFSSRLPADVGQLGEYTLR